METTATYFVCLNSDCERYRNIFFEGDPLHERCERRALELEGEEEQRGATPWAWIALAAGLGIAAAAAVTVIRTRRSADRPELHENRPMQTWSGSEAHLDERRGHPVPPPMK